MNTSNTPILSAIVAMSENRAIGKNNQLLWHLPADLRHFKELTTGHAILMGRKTYESIGKPLPNRTNIVLTRDKEFKAPGCIVVTSLEEALQHTNQNLFVIGGAEVYKQLLNKTNYIYLTIVHQVLTGDVYFPELNPQEWEEISREYHEPDEKNIYAYTFVELKRVG